jgi:hypothetical protein
VFDLFLRSFVSWNNRLREAVVTKDFFVFEHFFYSVLFTSYTLPILLSTRLWLKVCINLCITFGHGRKQSRDWCTKIANIAVVPVKVESLSGEELVITKDWLAVW